ncbi:MAG: hypothetical protein WAT53_10280 [Nitrosomonas sp.]|nr:hypothetical protein [Nitrosomonas sp.]
MKDRLLTIDTSRGVILTDNFNPLEALQARKSEYYRQLIIETVGTSQFVR